MSFRKDELQIEDDSDDSDCSDKHNQMKKMLGIEEAGEMVEDVENQIISSRFVKEIVKLNGDIRKFTTKSTIKSLKEKYE